MPDEDLSVFIQPQNTAAAAPAAAETSSSSHNFIPRHVVVKNLIKHHQDRIEAFDKAIWGVLLINCSLTATIATSTNDSYM
ncbi:MAG: hypothetical protein ACKPKO_06280, partial [Candidatus Fonsibacter sp.]